MAIDGCYIESASNAPAIDITTAPFTVTVTRSYLSTNNIGASASAIRVSDASKVVCQSCTFTVQAVTTASVIEVSAGDVRFSEGQIQRTVGSGKLINVSGASSVFVDRALMETVSASNAVEAIGTPFVAPSGAFPYKLLIANSSLTGTGTAAGVLANATLPTVCTILNTVFQIPVAQAIITATSPVVYGDLVCPPTYSTTISGALAVAYNEIHGNIFLPWTTAPVAGVYKPLAIDSNKQVQALTTLPASTISAIPYDVAGSVAGTSPASPDNYVFFFKATRAFTLSSTGTDHKFTARTGASASTDFKLYRDSVAPANLILTANFGAGGGAYQTATVTMGPATLSIPVDGLLIMESPSIPDGTLADIFWTLSATL